MSSVSGAKEQVPTRRELVGGLAIGGAAYALAGPLRAADAATERECVPNAPGTRADAIAASPDGRTIWVAETGGAAITSFRARDLRRRRSIDVGGAPISIAITADGDRAAVVTAAYDRPGLAIVDLAAREVERVEVGTDPRAVAVSPSGRRAYVVGGLDRGTLVRVDLRTGRVHEPIALGAHPRGIALYRNGTRALVTLNGASSLLVVDLAKRRVVRRIATAAFPSQVAVAPDGARALVTHDGYGARRVTPIDLRRGKALKPIRVGQDPGGAAFSRSGAGAVVTNSADGTATLLDARTGRRRRTVRGLGAPRAVAVAGSRAIVADGPSGQLKAIRLGALR